MQLTIPLYFPNQLAQLTMAMITLLQTPLLLKTLPPWAPLLSQSPSNIVENI